MTLEIPPFIRSLEARSDLLRLQTSGRSEHSFIHHNPNQRRLDVHYFFDPIKHRLMGGVYWGPDAEGPPGCGHGGSISTLMDDGMGTCAWAAGHRVVALNLNLNFKKFVPLLSWPSCEFWIEKTEGRKVFTRGELRNGEGELHAEASGLFLEIDFTKLLNRESHGPVA